MLARLLLLLRHALVAVAVVAVNTKSTGNTRNIYEKQSRLRSIAQNKTPAIERLLPINRITHNTNAESYTINFRRGKYHG
jgi:hypothetical protein